MKINNEKNKFDFSIQELNSLLDLIQKGQILYEDFSPIESTSFINPLKLVGNNPFIIEQSLNEDFVVYSKQLEQIKLLLEANRSEFIILRKSELKNQIDSITNRIEKLLLKEKELITLVSDAKVDYSDFRNIEFALQYKSVYYILSKIETIFINNANNPDITNKEKVNGFAYKVLSLFSINKKQTISDIIELEINSTKLEEYLKTSKDFKELNFSGSLDDKKNNCPSLKNEISKTSNNFKDKIEKEFDLLNLNSILNSNNKAKHFQAIESLTNDSNNSDLFRTKLQSIQSTFENFLTEINSLFKELSKELAESKDIKLNYTFDNSFEENKDSISELKAKIELIMSQFDSKIHNEFRQINLLEANPSEIEIKSLQHLQEKAKALADKIKSDSWTVRKVKFSELHKFISDTETLIQNKNEYFKADKDLFTIEFKWFQFYNGLTELNKTIVDELKIKSNWRKSFLVFYLNTMLINSANLDLPTNDDEHKELDQTLKDIEKEQLKFIKEFWYKKQEDSSARFEQENVNLSVGNLYLKKQGSKNTRLSLRQIVQFDADLFTDFFPIILTSPDVASNLFKGMNGYFDIVMFDEASQLRLEDNLPAILKGKQVIIAGDEHQMPPSNYFSKMFSGEIESDEDAEEEENETKTVIDKDEILLTCESLLDFGSELNFQKKHLDFHYRSRHPFLIDFSNYAFYNQRLKPLPNNFDYVPIKYVQVNGTFSEHTNEAEAEMVLAIIDKNINRLPNGEYPTLGIATLNIHQRNLIKSKILERQKFSKFEEFNIKIQELEEKGMFIKNLENIQGDERDVIILSTTYGIGKDGRVSERFGPINHTKGYKLLNVIISRAKFKIYCVTSIPESKFMNYKDYLISDGSNTKSGKASFFAYLAYSKAVSESNNELRLSVLTTLAENTSKSAGFDSFRGGDLESPFEEEVYQSLANHFGTDKLIPQLQFAGFRIDIVYDPKIVGVPKVAIECDGAKYHSSREAYLHDRHRQKILENHGFVFHRIWSTNWWRNSSRETNKLVDFIKQIELTKNSNHKDHSKNAFAFTDDITIIEDYVSQTSFIDTDKDIETIRSIEKVDPIQTTLFADEVKLSSKVKVSYLNNGKSLKVEIVATQNNKSDSSSLIQKIYYKSPLASALLGHKIGDIVKIGNLDNFVEILEVLNK